MRMPAIRPTVTIRVRQFLHENNISLVPWSTLDETYASLYTLLQLEKSNAAFWPSLSRLIQGIVDDTVADASLAAPKAELLSSWNIEMLVCNLQAALPSDDVGQSGSVSRYLKALPGPVLSIFLLLSAATLGCTNSDGATVVYGTDVDGDTGGDTDSTTDTTTESNSDTDSDTDSGTNAATHWTEMCSLDATGAIVGAIENGDMEDDGKLSLCECLEMLSQDWDSGLTELFESASEDETAQALSNLLRCCNYDGGWFEQTYSSATRDELVQNVLCEPVILYKGVAFADSELNDDSD